MDISSLVDVAFLLLIFFLVTSTLLPKEGDLEIALLGDSSPDVVQTPLPPMTVEIAENGSLSVGGEILEPAGGASAMPHFTDQVRRHVRIARAVDTDPIVVFLASDGAEHQRLVDALNAVSGEGVRHVTFDSGWRPDP